MTASDALARQQELFRQAQAGSPEAFGHLLETFRPYLLCLATEQIDSDLRPKGGASDLVQQTFLKAHKALPDFRGHTPSEMIAWLRQILLNNAANFRRQFQETQKRLVGKELSLDQPTDRGLIDHLPSDEPPPDSRLLSLEEMRRVEAALDQLSPSQRELVVWRNLERVPFADIAARLGVTEKVAQKRWDRAILALRKILKELS